jgi:very-short-patch-repair endonuclease
MKALAPIPPRNGEGDHAEHGGGALAASRPNLERARQLRNEMTFPEVLLWQALRTRPGRFKFRRQHPVGGYVADFACLSARLLIELDGEVHSHRDIAAIDRLRQSDLEAAGFKVLRIAARDVLDGLEAVIAMIVTKCEARAPLHQPAAGPPPRSGEDL